MLTDPELRGNCSPRDVDRCLLCLARQEPDALEELYQRTSPSVYSFALSILKNRHDAEDVLHDLYLQVFSAAAGYRSQGKPMAWLLTITRNLCLQKLRGGASPEPPGELWDGSPVTLEDRVWLDACMERLSDQERQIVVLHAVSGFKHREIAQMLDLPLPTVLSKYHRALKKLRQLFEGGAR